MGPRPQGQEPGLHRDKNPVSSGPAAEDSGGRGPASIPRTRSSSGPAAEASGGRGPSPQGQEPVSLGPTVEDSGGRGAVSTPTRAQSPQDLPRKEQAGRKRGWGRRGFWSWDAEGGGVQGTPRGRARRGFVRGDTVSPAGLCARLSGLHAPGSGAEGPRGRGSVNLLRSDAVPAASRARSRSRWLGEALPPLWPRGVRPASACGSGCQSCVCDGVVGSSLRRPRIC